MTDKRATDAEDDRPHCPVMRAPCSDREPGKCREHGCYKAAWRPLAASPPL